MVIVIEVTLLISHKHTALKELQLFISSNRV